MAMPKILVSIRRVGFGGIVTIRTHSRVCRQDRRTRLELNGHMALQMNGKAPVSSGGHTDDAAARAVRGVDGSVDRGMVEGLTVSHRAERSDVENSGR